MTDLRIPYGPVLYHEACAIMQDYLAGCWDELAASARAADRDDAEARGRAELARSRAQRLRAAGGTAVCVMRV